jgi:hypothetical protein
MKNKVFLSDKRDPKCQLGEIKSSYKDFVLPENVKDFSIEQRLELLR